jgi:hypothetical protein
VLNCGKSGYSAMSAVAVAEFLDFYLLVLSPPHLSTILFDFLRAFLFTNFFSPSLATGVYPLPNDETTFNSCSLRLQSLSS